MTKLVLALHIVLYLIGLVCIPILAAVIANIGNAQLGDSIMTVYVALGCTLAISHGILWLQDLRTSRITRRIEREKVTGDTKTFGIEESRLIRHPAERVWNLIRTADSAVLLSNAHRAFKVPGTPEGVGEQQCFITKDGSATIIEVIAEQAPNWAVTRSITTVEPTDGNAYTLKPEADGCLLALGMSFEAPSSSRWHSAEKEVWRSTARHYLNRVGQVLDSQFPNA